MQPGVGVRSPTEFPSAPLNGPRLTHGKCRPVGQHLRLLLGAGETIGRLHEQPLPSAWRLPVQKDRDRRSLFDDLAGEEPLPVR